MSKLNLKNLLSLAAAIFGLVTLFASSSVLFGYSDVLEKEGNYPSFILWVNLLTGPLYLLAAVGLAYSRKWTLHLLLIILITLVISLTVFILLLKIGENYETETLAALLIRITFTSMLTLFAYYKNHKKIKR